MAKYMERPSTEVEDALEEGDHSTKWVHTVKEAALVMKGRSLIIQPYF